MSTALRASMAAVALAACGGRVASEPVGEAGGTLGHGGAREGPGGAPGAGGGETGGETGDWLTADAETFCDRICTPERIDDGCLALNACRPGQCLPHAEGANVEVRAAYRDCVEQEPLCFQTVEACILDRLWPLESTLRTFEFHLMGLPPHMNLRVYVGATTGPNGQPILAEAVTSDGEVALTREWPLGSDSGPVFHVWADVDDDGLCESNQDLFGLGWSTWNGSFEEPGYSALVTDYDHDGAAACSVLGTMDVGR